MNKDDILRMSRKENQNGDEREEKIRLRSYAISASIGAFLCAIFGFVENVIFDRSTALIWVIYGGMLFSQSISNATKLKKKLDIVSSVICGLFIILSVVVYILENIG